MMMQVKTKLIILMVLVIIPFYALPQDTKISDYGKFKNYFEKLTTDPESSRKKIDFELAAKVINNNRIINEVVQSIYPSTIFEKGESTLYIIKLIYPMGGYTAQFVLLSFRDEVIAQAEIIGSVRLTNEGGRHSEINRINDTLLEVKSEELEFDEITDEEKVSNTIYNYYIINSEGFCKVEKGRISGARLFSQASYRIFEISELKNYQKADLDIMRNEIFADHGHIFQTEKWKSYFKDKSWYIPQYHDVNNMLTVIEKINIERILQVSQEKSY